MPHYLQLKEIIFRITQVHNAIIHLKIVLVIILFLDSAGSFTELIPLIQRFIFLPFLTFDSIIQFINYFFKFFDFHYH